MFVVSTAGATNKKMHFEHVFSTVNCLEKTVFELKAHCVYRLIISSSENFNKFIKISNYGETYESLLDLPPDLLKKSYNGFILSQIDGFLCLRCYNNRDIGKLVEIYIEEISTMEGTTKDTYDRFLPNPLNSVLSKRKLLCESEFLSKDKYEAVNSGLRFIYMYEVLKANNGVSSVNVDGSINEKVVKENIRNVINSILSENHNSRCILRLIPELESNSLNNAIEYDFKGENVYSYLPKDVLDVFCKYESYLSSISLPTRSIYRQQNLLVLDLSSIKVKELYRQLLGIFKEILNEHTISPGKDDNGNKLVIRYGDYFPILEIGFCGPWGESRLDNFECNFKTSDLIEYVEMYKSTFPDYILIAPLIVCEKKFTKPSYYDYAYYLVTTTYGSLKKDKQGLLTGDKKFGFFRDCITANLRTESYNINNNQLGPLIFDRFHDSPIIGESSNEGIVNPQWLLDNILRYHVSSFKYYSATPQNANSNNELIRRAINICGYRLEIRDIEVEIIREEIKGAVRLMNTGVAPCYDAFWKIQFVLRNNKGELLHICDSEKKIPNVTSNPTCGNKSGTTDCIYFGIDLSSYKNVTNEVCLFMRIIDSKQIDSNMYLGNAGRSVHGEYLLKKIDL